MREDTKYNYDFLRHSNNELLYITHWSFSENTGGVSFEVLIKQCIKRDQI